MQKVEWWTLGELNVSADKRDELNNYVLQLLDMGGIRKIRKMKINGRFVKVLEKPLPDENGIVRFDYSIFEKIERQVCWYDMNTCELTLNDHGGNEFGLIMNSIILLQESYSETHYYLMQNDEIVSDVRRYLNILYELLGKAIYCPRRARLWDMVLFLRTNGIKLSEKTSDKLLTSVFSVSNVSDMPQLFAGMFVLDPESIDDRPCKITTKKEIADNFPDQRQRYLIKILKALIQTDDQKLDQFLKTLFESTLEERIKLATSQDEYGDLAELSLYMLPAEIISFYSTIRNKSFWDEWDRFNITPYSDTIIKLQYFTPKRNNMFSAIIRRANEDEFLEFWDTKDLRLSDDLTNHIAEWEKSIHTIHEIPEAEMDSALFEVIDDLQNIWRCRYVDKEFVVDMLKNKNNIMYRKALALFQEIMKVDVNYFPELPAKQATEWMVRRFGDKHTPIVLMAYHSLLRCSNKRKQILCF